MLCAALGFPATAGRTISGGCVVAGGQVGDAEVLCAVAALGKAGAAADFVSGVRPRGGRALMVGQC